MLRPSKNLKKSLASLVANLEWGQEVADYLATRGINHEAAQAHHLGVVPHGFNEWSQYAGMLAIPYETVTGIVNMKFRSLTEKQYLNLPNATANLYNAKALANQHSDIVVICEGELDAVIVNSVVGIPAVAIPGVNQWKPWLPRCFDGHQHVLIATDNDDRDDGRNPGRELAEQIAKSIPHATIILPPKGLDMTDLFLERGVFGVTEHLGVT